MAASTLRPFISPILFFLLVGLVTYAFWELVAPFMMVTFWAAVLAIVFYRPYRIIRVKLDGKSNMAALATLAIILLAVLLPLAAIGAALVNESLKLYNSIQSGEIDVAAIIDAVEQQLPLVSDFLGSIGVDTTKLRESLSTTAMRVSQVVAGSVLGYTQNLITLIINFFLMLYLLFFFIRDGRQIMRAIMHSIPLGDRMEEQLFVRFATTARATLKGSLIVAVTQGTIGGIAFWILGIPGAVFWGTIMTLLSLLPAVGSGIIWAPAALILFLNGERIEAIILVLIGVLVIGLVDNILRPILVGRDTRMPDYLVLLSTLGGLAWFGLSGFVIGPCIAALFITVWEIVGKEYGGKGG